MAFLRRGALVCRSKKYFDVDSDTSTRPGNFDRSTGSRGTRSRPDHPRGIPRCRFIELVVVRAKTSLRCSFPALILHFSPFYSQRSKDLASDLNLHAGHIFMSTLPFGNFKDFFTLRYTATSRARRDSPHFQ